MPAATRPTVSTSISILLAAGACSGGSPTTTANASETSTAASTTSAASTATSSTSSSTSPPTTTSSTDATASTASTAASSTGDETTTGGPLTRCPTIAAPIKTGTLADPAIAEASGLAASRSQPGVLWTHNDSGDEARVFAIDPAGSTLGAFVLDGVSAIDWEDIALGPGPTPGEWLYVGDIGDNLSARRSVTVLRAPEPKVDGMGGTATLAGVEAIELTYPDGAHDAETLLIDPPTGDLFIVAKGEPTRVFRRPGPLLAGGPFPLDEVLPVAAPITFATAGDVSPLGDFVALRGYFQGALWIRPPGGDLAQAFATSPCALSLAVEVQGEALAIAADGKGYTTVSEMGAQPLWFFAFE